MRTPIRILPALAIVAALVPFALRAQEPPAPAEAASEAVSPDPEPTPAPEDLVTLVAPDDGPPSADRTEGDIAAAASVESGGVDPAAPAPPADPAGSAASAAAEALARPPAPSVEIAVGAVETVREVSAGRTSNWFFLAAVGLAVVLIATKVAREKGERVSIHEP